MSTAQKYAMPPHISLTQNWGTNDAPRAHLSLEFTIQSIHNGEVGSPKSPKSPASPALTATAFDAAAEEYDTALLRRDAVVLRRLGIDPSTLDSSVLRGIQPQVRQPQPMSPARQSLLGILNPRAQEVPVPFGHTERPAVFTAPTAFQEPNQHNGYAARPTNSEERPSQFSQLFPEGMCAPGQQPFPSMADTVYQAVLMAQAVGDAFEVEQPAWGRVYTTIQRPASRRGVAPPTFREQERAPIREQKVIQPSKASQQEQGLAAVSDVPERCPLGVRLYPAVEEEGS
ncbi:hypothetical protein DFH07DRAFT_840157, partial [Mycena maculata]